METAKLLFIRFSYIHINMDKKFENFAKKMQGRSTKRKPIRQPTFKVRVPNGSGNPNSEY